jgi:hypothetical protein
MHGVLRSQIQEAGLVDHVWNCRPFFHDLFNIDRPILTILINASGILFLRAMKKETKQKQALAVRCPTCGAAPGKKCELSTGQPRTEPHRDRRLIGADLS